MTAEARSPITTHVLDTSRGRPAAGVAVRLDRRDPDGAFRPIGRGQTDEDGRCRTLLEDRAAFAAGTYRIAFDTGAFFAAQGTPAFFPFVEIVFEVGDPRAHYHVPLLLSPFGYSTYRGS